MSEKRLDFARIKKLIRCERAVHIAFDGTSTAPLDDSGAELAFHQSDDGAVHAIDKRPLIRSGRVELEGSVVVEDGGRVLVGTTAILWEVQMVIVVFCGVFALASLFIMIAILSGMPSPESIGFALLVWSAFGAAPTLGWFVVRGISEDSHDFVVRAVARRLR